MRTFCNRVRTGKPLIHHQPYATPVDPLPVVIAKRPHLAPSVGTSFATDEHLDAQQEWLAQIAAGRIGIGCEFAQTALVSANIGNIRGATGGRQGDSGHDVV